MPYRRTAVTWARERGPQQNSRNVGKRERSANKWLRFRSRKVLERPKGSSCAY